MNDYLERIPLHLIRPSRWQARDAQFDVEALLELAQSIRDNGLINPVTVFEYVNGDGCTGYELVAGERRTRACMALALTSGELAGPHDLADYVGKLANMGIPGLRRSIYEELLKQRQATIAATIKDGSDLQRLHIMAVIENLDRAGLAPLEEARGYQALAEAYGWSQRELACRVHRSQGYIAQRLCLLYATPELQAAVNTRVLTLTTARALATVPAALQPRGGGGAGRAPHRPGGGGGARGRAGYPRGGGPGGGRPPPRPQSPATTREIEQRARQLTAFVDPQRWQPNPEHIYEPRQRNLLRLLQQAVAQASLTHPETGQRLIALPEHSYGGSNLLSRRPVALIRRSNEVLDVLHALRRGTDELTLEQLWQLLAGVACHTCASCIWQGAPANAAGPFRVPCSRLRGENVETCLEYVGSEDPPVLLLQDWELRRLLSGSPYGEQVRQDGSQEYLSSLETYLAALAWAKTHYAARQQLKQEQQDIRHIEELRVYWEWQQSAYTQHFQAHGCTKCRYYAPLNAAEGLPPCYLARDPIICGEAYRKGQVRAPEFALLCGENNILPRCEAFAYRDPPHLDMRKYAGFDFGEQHSIVLGWIANIVAREYSCSGLWGMLSWLDYGRGPEQQTTDKDVSRLLRWLDAQWDALGGAPAMALLLEMLLAENGCGQRCHGQRPNTLLNSDGRSQRWKLVGWNRRAEPPWDLHRWPENILKPWEKTDND